MFSTQTTTELGLNNFVNQALGWEPHGLYVDEVEPIDDRGSGAGIQKAIEELKKRVLDRYGNQTTFTQLLIANTKIETFPGNAHPSYGRKIYRVTGDLYLKRK